VLGEVAAEAVGGAPCFVVALGELAARWSRARCPGGWRGAGRTADLRVVAPRREGADGGAAFAVPACPGNARAAALANTRVRATVAAAIARLSHRRRRSPALRRLLRWACGMRFIGTEAGGPG
jgi:hypothetical protein